MSEKEIKDLEQTYQRLYYNHTVNRQQQQIDLPMFTKILSAVLPSILIPGIFEAFDENRDGRKQRKQRQSSYVFFSSIC